MRHSWGRFGLAVVLLVLPLQALGAIDDINILHSFTVPAVYYVGDETEIRVQFRSPASLKLELPHELPKPDWGELRSLKLVSVDDGYELRIRCVSFETGTKAVPPIRLGTVSIDGLSIYVSSVLTDKDQNLRPMRGQLLLPGTEFRVVAQILVVLSLPLLCFLFVRYGLPFLKKRQAARKARLPYRRLHASLRNIDMHIGTASPKDFYVQLLDEARAYLNDRLGIPAISATTHELSQRLELALQNKDAVDGFIALFGHGDQVKFGDKPVSAEVQHAHIKALENLSGLVEGEKQRFLSEKTKQGAKHVVV